MSLHRLESARRKFRHILGRTFSMSSGKSADKNPAAEVERTPDRWVPVTDGAYGWLVVLGSFLIHVFADGFVYSFGVIAETLVKEFGSTNAEVSWILSLLTGLMLAAGPIASSISNRFGCRACAIAGAIIASIGCGISSQATSMAFLTISVGIIMGCGFGLMYCPAIMIVTMYFEKRRSLATGITVCGAGVGTTIFAKVIALLIQKFSWQKVFIIYAGVVLLCVPCAAIFKPLAFEPVYDDEVEKARFDEKDEKRKTNGKLSPDQTSKLKAHLLSPVHLDANGKLRAAISHHDVNDTDRSGVTNLQRVQSLGEHLQQRHKSHQHLPVSSLGYLNVKDIFYQRSINELQHYKENVHSIASLPCAHKESIKRSTKEVLRDLPEEDENLDSAATSASRAIELWRSFKKMTDIGLLAEPIFILFAISNFFTSIGFNAPPMFMPMNAEVVLGFSKDDSSTTVSAYGFANTIGRILFGLICDLRLPFKYGKDTARNRLWIYNLMLIFNGITTSFVYQMESYFTYVTYCFIFGLTISSYVCLTSVVLVDLIGIDRLTNGLGLLFFVQGVATFVGPPIAGKLFDYTRRYDWTFAFCGICLFISGAILYAIPIFFAGKQHYELASKNDRLEDKEFNADTPMLVKSEP